MDDKFFTEFLSYTNLVVYAALVVLGMILKQTPKIENWFIPWVMLFVGIIIGWSYLGGKSGILDGIILAGLAVFGHQLYSQLRYGATKEDRRISTTPPPTDNP